MPMITRIARQAGAHHHLAPHVDQLAERLIGPHGLAGLACGAEQAAVFER